MLDESNELEIGRRLRERRHKLSFTLEEVAKQTRLTKGFLSDVERGKTAPSLSNLVLICRTLGVDVSTLLAGSNSNLVRKSERRAVYFGDPGIKDFQLTPAKERRLLALWTEVEPGARAGEKPYSFTSEEEFFLVLSGEVVIQVDETQYELKEGDALTLDARSPHIFWNASTSKPATILMIFTPPPR